MGELTVLDIENEHAKASISLYGGQVLSFQPKGQGDVLWVSPAAIYEKGKAIRGGIPVCWPWFGKRKEGGPNHGFARTRDWNLDSHELLESGESRLVLSLSDCDHSDWEGKASLSLEVVVGKTLKLKLTTQNVGKSPFAISQALHSYFSVEHVENIQIKGLDGADYIDSVNEGKRCVQSGDVTFKGEVDRVYVDESSHTTLFDPDKQREITVAKSGSNATVVWNPGYELAVTMADLPAESFHSMACVETATSPENPERVESGESHIVSVEISIG